MPMCTAASRTAAATGSGPLGRASRSTDSRWRARSCVLENHAFDDVRDVLALIRRRFQQLVDRLELDQLADVGFLAKQLGERRTHHPIRLRLQGIDLVAQLQDL